MNSGSKTTAADLGLALPMMVLALAVWKAFTTLTAAWENDLYARGALTAFIVWLASQGFLYFRDHTRPRPSGFFWIALSLALCAAGSLTGLRVLFHLSVACAIPGLFGLNGSGVIAVAAAISWLPASGWFIDHWKSGGLAGWERPLFAVIMAILLLVSARIFHQSSHP